jgi:hypothetical protein
MHKERKFLYEFLKYQRIKHSRERQTQFTFPNEQCRDSKNTKEKVAAVQLSMRIS